MQSAGPQWDRGIFYWPHHGTEGYSTGHTMGQRDILLVTPWDRGIFYWSHHGTEGYSTGHTMGQVVFHFVPPQAVR